MAQHGKLYYDLASYPYTVCAYMPLFYFLEAGLNKVGLPTALGGRLVSFLAMLGLFALVWKLVILYSGDRLCAWTGTVLCASTSVVLAWGTVGQVDTLAVFWSVAAFYQYARYSRNPTSSESSLWWAGACALLAIFTKQTAIACPVTIFVLLWFTRRKTALLFGTIFGGTALALVLAINLALGGRFLLNTVFANMNELILAKLGAHLQYILVAALQLIIIAIVGIKPAWRAHKMAPYVYLAFASLVFLVTAPKLGSDTNYQIELTVMLVVCASIALHSLNFFELCFSGSRSWITLLQLALAIHVVENFRISENVLLTRVGVEQMLRTQVTALSPYLADGGRLLSTDYNSMARLRGYMEVEPLIYNLLVRARVVNPEPLRRDLQAEAFSTIFLYEDVVHPENLDPEVSTFPAAQLEEIRKHYRLIARVPGPYLDGIFVYKPVFKPVARGAE
jgi:4-amino-4-deoxy-L-arabinose transferase-like glycosyltransferase